MKISIITLFPDMISGFFKESIVKRAIEKGIVSIDVIPLRTFALDSYGTVDDRPYGGGAGMIMRVDVLAKTVRSLPKGRVVFTSPRGKRFTQTTAATYSKEEHLILLAGHYEGIDERAFSFIDEEVSVGDFVMTGGEIAIAAIVDSVVRLIPGVLKKDDATTGESFADVELSELTKIIKDPALDILIKAKKKKVTLLEYPQFTRPSHFEGKGVPEVLLSGDPKKIREWQLIQSWQETKKRRPDLLEVKT